MGGCRCTFRDCTKNTSNSPGMHFFHFPYKDPERCQRWAKYSGNLHYVQLETAKLRNKVVCEMHFHDENFMNYKRERLIQQAVPTLVRLEDGYVLDYEDGDDPKPKFLNPTNLQHLVPPQTQQVCIEVRSETAEKRLKPREDVDGPQPAKIVRIGPPPRILNVSAPQNKATLPRLFGPVVHQISTGDESPTFTLEAVAVAEAEVAEVDFEPVTDDARSIELDDDVPELAPEMMLKSVHDEEKLEFLKEIESLKAEIASKDCELEMLRQELEALRTDVAVKPSVSVTQVETITTSRKSESGGSAAPPSKAQLFNGIKKYLGPSMAAMVRMEMFGGPEREWKQDERNVSVELLGLGEHVFDFVRDEWRCRLPPKRDVEQWLSQRGQIEDDEEL